MFSNSGSLRIYDAERPSRHECSGCGRAFSSSGPLRTHESVCEDVARKSDAVLQGAREKFYSRPGRKRRRLGNEPASIAGPSSSHNAVSGPVAPQPADMAPQIITSRSGRVVQMPRRFHDAAPEAAVSLIADAQPSRSPTPQPTTDTPCNSFGLYRRYHSSGVPAHDPEAHVDFDELVDILPVDNSADTAASDAEEENDRSDEEITSPYAPYDSKSAFEIDNWFWSAEKKSLADFDKLVAIIGSEDFNPADIRATNFKDIREKLAGGHFEGHKWRDPENGKLQPGWRASSISISVPFPPGDSGPGPQTYHSEEPFYHRSLTQVVRETLQDPSRHERFHYEPFELLWLRPGDEKSVRVHGELYTSPAFMEAHQRLQDSPKEPGCELQRVVVACMFASDSTPVTQFGDGYLWPGYLAYGNESKYSRGKPTKALVEHIAYFQKVGRIACCIPLANSPPARSSPIHSKISSSGTAEARQLRKH